MNNPKTNDRSRLEARYGQVWDLQQFLEHFDVTGFAAPYVLVRRRDTGQQGSVEFISRPRLYFNYVPH